MMSVDFREQVEGWLLERQLVVRRIKLDDTPFDVLLVESTNGKKLLLHLIDLATWQQSYHRLTKCFFTILIDKLRTDDTMLVHLWEDVWRWRMRQVQSRILTLLGKNSTLPGRLTETQWITKQDAASFLEQWHVNGTVSSVYQLGLYLPARRWHYLPKEIQEAYLAPIDLLVGVATFGRLRPMRHIRDNYVSGELVRLASIGGITITGGLSKLIKKFAEQYATSDIMTYADRDWSEGASYAQSGFSLKGEKEAFEFIIDPTSYQRTARRVLIDECSEQEMIIGWNAGSKKWVKTTHN